MPIHLPIQNTKFSAQNVNESCDVHQTRRNVSEDVSIDNFESMTQIEFPDAMSGRVAVEEMFPKNFAGGVEHVFRL